MRNVGSIDRFFRAFVGVIFLELAVFWLSGTLQIAAYVVGGILVATAAIAFCPLYRIVGIERGYACAVGQRPRIFRIVMVIFTLTLVPADMLCKGRPPLFPV